MATAVRKPLLNIDDLPEAQLSNTGGWDHPPQRHRRTPCRNQRRLWVTKFDKSALLSVPEAFEFGVQTERVCEGPWACLHCTFHNAGLLQRCEMCEEPRGLVSLSLLAGNPASSLASFSDEIAWPSLAEAGSSWDCLDGSSIGSSWLDMAEILEPTDDDGCSDFLLLEECMYGDGLVDVETSAMHSSTATQPAVPSWASRVACTSNQNFAARQCPAFPMPPCWHRSNRLLKEMKIVNEDVDVEDDDLAQLQDRRMHPAGCRGATHRRRQAQRRLR